jgi:hypothetical protein
MRVRCASTYRKIIAFSAFITLALHSLIPLGYMPDFSGHGLLVLCDGIDHQAMSAREAHAAHAGHDHACHSHSGVCPFSVGIIYSSDGITPPLINPPIYDAEAVALTEAAPPKRRADYGSASPRSPPAFS